MVGDEVTIGKKQRLSEAVGMKEDGKPGNHGVEAIFFHFLAEICAKAGLRVC